VSRNGQHKRNPARSREGGKNGGGKRGGVNSVFGGVSDRGSLMAENIIKGQDKKRTVPGESVTLQLQKDVRWEEILGPLKSVASREKLNGGAITSEERKWKIARHGAPQMLPKRGWKEMHNVSQKRGKGNEGGMTKVERDKTGKS